MTRADFFRSMSDEELAEMFTDFATQRDRIMLEKLAKIGLSGVDLVEHRYLNYFAYLQFLKEEMESEVGDEKPM